MIQETSIRAYHDLKPKLNHCEKIILQFLKMYGNHTNKEIHKGTGLEISNVTGRVNALVKKGLVLEVCKRKCMVSGKRVIEWGLGNPQVQQKFPFAGGGV